MFSQTLVFNEGSTDLSSDGEDEIQENATITQTKEILSPQTSGSKTQEPQSDSRSLILWAASLELESIGLKRNSSLLQKTLADSCDSLNKILRDIQKGLEKWNRLSSQTVQQKLNAKLDAIEQEISHLRTENLSPQNRGISAEFKEFKRSSEKQHDEIMRQLQELHSKMGMTSNSSDPRQKPLKPIPKPVPKQAAKKPIDRTKISHSEGQSQKRILIDTAETEHLSFKPFISKRKTPKQAPKRPLNRKKIPYHEGKSQKRTLIETTETNHLSR